MKTRLNKGFTLIELMVVVAIIAILAALAVPAYGDWVTRSKLSEAISAAAPVAASVQEGYLNGKKNTGPGANNWGGETTAETSKYVKLISTNADGVITITVQNTNNADVDDKTISLTPYKDDTTAATAGDIPTRIYKMVCTHGATNPVPDKYLPSNCK